MLGFIRRNAKLAIVTGVSLLLIAGLTTALIFTNVGTGSARGRDRGTSRIELTEEQIAERIAERIEIRRERLEQRLADGSITQEYYDEKIAAIESGEYPAGDRVRGNRDRNRDDNGEKGRGNKQNKADKTEAPPGT